MLKCTHNGHLYTCTPCYKLYCIHLFLWVYVRTTNCNNKSCNWNCYLLIYLFIMWSFKLFHPSSHTRKNIYTYWTFFKLNAAIGIKYENFIFKQRINGAIRQMNWKNGNKVATDKCKIDFVVFIRFFFCFFALFWLSLFHHYPCPRNKAHCHIDRIESAGANLPGTVWCQARVSFLFPFYDNRI